LGGAAEHTDKARVGDVVGCGRNNDGCRALCNVAVMEPVGTDGSRCCAARRTEARSVTADAKPEARNVYGPGYRAPKSAFIASSILEFASWNFNGLSNIASSRSFSSGLDPFAILLVQFASELNRAFAASKRWSYASMTGVDPRIASSARAQSKVPFLHGPEHAMYRNREDHYGVDISSLVAC
jgi:hypothetical protein